MPWWTILLVMLLTTGPLSAQEPATPPAAPTTVPVSVRVSGVASATGKLTVHVYNDPDPKVFLKREFLIIRQDLANQQPGQVAQVSIPLPPGEYAISAYHDRNDNGKIDSNLIGVPSEPYGWANRVHPKWSPPAWKDVRVTVAAGMNPVEIEVRDW